MDEQEQIRRCQAGDVKAFEALFQQHVRMAVRTAYLITRDWAAAEDAAQEAFVRAFRSIRSFRLGQGFGPWLYRIVVNEARRLTHRNAPKALPPLEMPTIDQPSPEELILDRERASGVWAALHQLGEEHRIVLVLKYFNGFTEQEIAEALDLRPSTVKSRLYVARQRLATLLA